MGKQNRPYRFNKHQGNKRPRVDGDNQRQTNVWRYKPGDVISNPVFDKYYKAMGFIPEEEWSQFIKTLQEPLPVTFRLNPLSHNYEKVRERLNSDPEFSKAVTLSDNRVVPPPKSLSWYPDAWQLGFGKPDLRKNDSLKKFHEWIQILNAEGSISRQEAVSMIPPLLLDVQSSHRVLDMCAAPGSKTAQLLEALHRGEMNNTAASGFVIANDSDSKRAYLLTHQCQRIGSPSLLVACHDAQVFPNLNANKPELRLPKPAPGQPPQQRIPGCFDRVLCDVPCSGDGTARKNVEAYARWNPAGGLGLHPLQIQIALRGLALLKVGGLLAYSTCSMNPIEDEAVVAEVLRRCNGAVELVDVSEILPGLNYSPGVSKWPVFDRNMNEHADFASYSVADSDGNVGPKKKLSPTCFPPSEEDAKKYNLHRCMRILPHSQDTGGFFICLLKKTAPLPTARPWLDASQLASKPEATENDDCDSEDEITGAKTGSHYALATSALVDSVETETKSTASEAEADEASQPAVTSTPTEIEPKKTESEPMRDSKGRALSGRFELTVYTPTDSETVNEIKNAFGLSDNFPLNLLHSRGDANRNISVLAPVIVDEVLPLQKLTDGSGSIKTVNTGIKVFSENKGDKYKTYVAEMQAKQAAAATLVSESKDAVAEEKSILSTPYSIASDYRIMQEGVALMAPFLTKQMLFLSSKEILEVFRYRGQMVTQAVYPSRMRAALQSVAIGSFAIAYCPALDGLEASEEAYPRRTDGLPSFLDLFDVEGSGTDTRVIPKASIPKSYIPAVAPSLAQHYLPEGGSDSLQFKPSLKVFTGSNPLTRLIACMWRGKNKYNLMVHGEDIASLVEIIKFSQFGATLDK